MAQVLAWSNTQNKLRLLTGKTHNPQLKVLSFNAISFPVLEPKEYIRASDLYLAVGGSGGSWLFFCVVKQVSLLTPNTFSHFFAASPVLHWSSACASGASSALGAFAWENLAWAEVQKARGRVKNALKTPNRPNSPYIMGVFFPQESMITTGQAKGQRNKGTVIVGALLLTHSQELWKSKPVSKPHLLKSEDLRVPWGCHMLRLWCSFAFKASTSAASLPTKEGTYSQKHQGIYLPLSIFEAHLHQKLAKPLNTNTFLCLIDFGLHPPWHKLSHTVHCSRSMPAMFFGLCVSWKIFWQGARMLKTKQAVVESHVSELQNSTSLSRLNHMFLA